MNNALKIIDFMKIVEQLCLVERDNLMSSGRQETDADHILKLSFLVLMVHPYLNKPADCAKMLELALVHDLVEARTGDYSLSAQAECPELKARKKTAEKEAILYYRSVLRPPLNERVYGLFMEYEARETREAKLVWILDKLEANLQANRYHDGDIRYWADCENGDWYYQSAVTQKPQIAEQDEEILTELEKIIINISKENMERCGIRNCGQTS